MDKTLNNKILGSLIGGIIGANICVDYEGLRYKGREKELADFRRKEKLDSITSIEKFDNFNYILDDGLADLVYEKLIEKGNRINYRDLADKWIGSLDNNKFKIYINNLYRAPGFYDIRNSLELLKKGTPSKLIGSLNAPTSSAFHMSIPIGLFNIFDPIQAFYDTFDLTSIVQRNEARYLPGLLSYIISDLAYKENNFITTLDSLIKDIDKGLIIDNYSLNISKEELIEMIRDIKDLSDKKDNFIDSIEYFYENKIKRSFSRFADDPLETFLFILFILANITEYDKVITASINTFRDTTTIGFICGSISGFVKGIKTIPNNWINNIPKFRYKKAEKISIEMINLINNKFNSMKIIQNELKNYFK